MPETLNPTVYVIAGPNGAGKPTFAQEYLLRHATRVREGGHNIPEETIRRRYQLGIQNL